LVLDSQKYGRPHRLVITKAQFDKPTTAMERRNQEQNLYGDDYQKDLEFLQLAQKLRQTYGEKVSSQTRIQIL